MKTQWLLTALLLMGIVLAGGCVNRTAVLTDHPDFLAVKGKRFSIVIETCVFQYSDAERLAPPMIGFASVAPGVGLEQFPNNPADLVGRKSGSIKVLSVIPRDTTFTVIRHRTKESFPMGLYHHFDVQLDGPLREQWPLLDGFYLTRQNDGSIHFHPEVVKE